MRDIFQNVKNAIQVNGTVWSIRIFKFVLSCFHCLCTYYSLCLECAFSVGQASHLSSLLCLLWLYLFLMAPVVVYVTACVSLPLDCEFFAGHILLILRIISVLVQSGCLINIC